MSNAGFTANPTPDTQVEGPDGTVARSISDSDRDIGDADNSSITSDASTGEAITQHPLATSATASVPTSSAIPAPAAIPAPSITAPAPASTTQLALPPPSNLRVDQNPYINLYGYESERTIIYKSKLALYSGVIEPSRLPPGVLPKKLTQTKTGCHLKCRICRSKFRTPSNVQGHFVKCVERNGNPLGWKFTEFINTSARHQSKGERTTIGAGGGRKLR